MLNVQCQLQFKLSSLLLPFIRFELDQLDTPDKYPDLFTVTLDVLVAPVAQHPMDRRYPWENYSSEKLSPRILFSSKEELHSVFSEFGEYRSL